MLHVLSLSSSDATKIATGLAPVVTKEGNEAALGAELFVLSQAVIRLLQSDTEVPKPAVEAFVKGLGDKKLPARRLWVLRSGDVLLSVTDNPEPPSVHVAKVRRGHYDAYR